MLLKEPNYNTLGLAKKVLIITYYWPPAGGPGVQRWLKFVKYLPDFNIEPIVFCPESPNYPIIDKTLTKEVSPKLLVLKHPIKEPYRFAELFSKKQTKQLSSGVINKDNKQSFIQRVLLFVRGNFFIPDARKYWVKPSVKFLQKYITAKKIDVVITTGPPHSIHLIGLQLKQKLPIKWITDFRDPWTTIGYHKALKLTARSKEKHLYLEQLVLNNSDEIIVTSQHTKQEFSVKTSKPITVITNGYDSHFVKIDSKDTKFTISHIGSLLSDRNPKVLWEVLSELIQEYDDFAEQFQLQFIGIISHEVLTTVTSYGLGSHIKTIGYVTHEEAIRYQLRSQVLLLIEIDSNDTKAIIPGKLFEYINSHTPILAIGPKDSDVEHIISNTKTGCYFNYSNKKELKVYILKLFEDYKTDSISITPKGIEVYSRKALTGKLAQLIK